MPRDRGAECSSLKSAEWWGVDSLDVTRARSDQGRHGLAAGALYRPLVRPVLCGRARQLDAPHRQSAPALVDQRQQLCVSSSSCGAGLCSAHAVYLQRACVDSAGIVLDLRISLSPYVLLPLFRASLASACAGAFALVPLVFLRFVFCGEATRPNHEDVVPALSLCSVFVSSVALPLGIQRQILIPRWLPWSQHADVSI